MLTKTGYKPRLIDDKIGHYLKIFGALCIEGPKWCGKTWTALNHANSAIFMNDSSNNFQNRRYAEMDVDTILDGYEAPELIDEWQEVPAIWDAVRYKCDFDRRAGKYILTGSATPVEKQLLHSGAGRICRLNMHTMTLYESGDSAGLVGLNDLFNHKLKQQIVPEVKLKHLAYYIIRGGWPENLKQKEEDATIIPRSYLSNVLKHDISNLDGTERDSRKMELLMRSLARNESSLASNTTLMADITEKDESGLGKNTITDYLNTLANLSIIEEIPAFSPNLRSSNRIGKSPKRHFTDPSLAAAALGLTVETLISDLHTFGLFFESLCLHELQVYIEMLDGKLFHFRDNVSGREIDAIVELPNGKYGAIEIKLGTDTEDIAASNLLDFAANMDVKPEFLAVVNGLGNLAFRRPDGVYVVPIAGFKG